MREKVILMGNRKKLLIILIALPAWALLVWLAATRFYSDSKLEPNVRRLYERDDFSMHELFNTDGFNNFGYWPNSLPEFISSDLRLKSSLELYRQVAQAGCIVPDDVILDVGCGRGGGALFLTQEIGPIQIVGLDFCPRQLEQAKLLAVDIPSIAFVQGRAESLPCPSTSIDKVISVGAAQHFADIEAFTADAYRILKPGGKLVVSTFFGVKRNASQRLKTLIPTFKIGVDRCYDLGSYLLTLRKTGFNKIEIVSIGERVFPGFDTYMEQEGLGGYDWNRNWKRAYDNGYIDYVIIVATKTHPE